MLKLIIANIEIPAVQVLANLLSLLLNNILTQYDFTKKSLCTRKNTNTNKGDYPSSLQNDTATIFQIRLELASVVDDFCDGTRTFQTSTPLLKNAFFISFVFGLSNVRCAPDCTVQ